MAVETSKSSVVSDGATSDEEEGDERGCCFTCVACFDETLDDKLRACK